MRDYKASPVYVKFGKILHKVRTDKKMSRAELGRAVGLTRQSMHNIETGVQKPNLDAIYDMAKKLEVPVVDLLPKG